MQTIFNLLQTQLKGLYPETEIRSFYYLIIEKLTGLTRTQIILNKNTLFSTEQHHEVENFIKKLKKFIPIQYILGETEFYGLPFIVNESVLIPRPETEELIDWISKENDRTISHNILDIGTGSGCIAISLKNEFKTSNVDAFDISESALQTARKNSKLNKLNINYSLVDILQTPIFEKKWDIIVSNPPYIPENDKNEMETNVLDNEPHQALFVPNNDPLIFYRHIAMFAKKYLNSSGKVYFEIHRDYGKQCIDLLVAMGFGKVELRKDISGNDRMVRAFVCD